MQRTAPYSTNAADMVGKLNYFVPLPQERTWPCSESDDEGGRGGPRPDDEAEEEDDELEAIFKGQKGRKRRASHAESITKGVEDLLAHMEVASERDMEAIQENKPAIEKFKMLKEVWRSPKRSKGCISSCRPCLPCQALLAHTCVSLGGHALDTYVEAGHDSHNMPKEVIWGHKESMLMRISGITSGLM